MKRKLILSGIGILLALSALYGAGSTINGARTIFNSLTIGTDNSAAGTLQLANGSANAHTIWTSGATTSNTIAGFATAPTTGHVVTCTTSGTTCTLTDGGAPAACTICVIGTASFSASGGSISNKVVAGVISDITRTSAGLYNVVFTTNQSNYTASILPNSGTTVPFIYYMNTADTSPPAAGFQFATVNATNLAAADSVLVLVTIFK